MNYLYEELVLVPGHPNLHNLAKIYSLHRTREICHLYLVGI